VWDRVRAARERLHVLHLGLIAPVLSDLVHQVPGDDRRVQLGCQHGDTTLLLGF
jgi:hypothetical protein